MCYAPHVGPIKAGMTRYPMRARSLILLGIALLTTAASFIRGLDAIGGGILRPLGAVLMIAFFIDLFTANEIAAYNEQTGADQNH